MGLGLPDIESFQKYFGKLTLINKNVGEDVYPGNYICKTHKKDLIYISSWPTSDSDAYFIDYTKCKLKNVINIKKTTSMGMFLKKLGVKQYNYNSKTHTLDFICGKCYCISNVDDDDDAEYEDVWWTIKMNNKNQIMPSTVVKFELITDWQIW